MVRTKAAILAALLQAGVLAAAPAGAGEMCIACEEPNVTYRCSLDQVPEKYSVGKLQQKICSKVLAQQGAHKRCRPAEPPDGVCQGQARTVTLADFQRAKGSSAESTYEVGAMEVARRNVHSTWLCLTSMFKDC